MIRVAAATGVGVGVSGGAVERQPPGTCFVGASRATRVGCSGKRPLAEPKGNGRPHVPANCPSVLGPRPNSRRNGDARGLPRQPRRGRLSGDARRAVRDGRPRVPSTVPRWVDEGTPKRSTEMATVTTTEAISSRRIVSPSHPGRSPTRGRSARVRQPDGLGTSLDRSRERRTSLLLHRMSSGARCCATNPRSRASHSCSHTSQEARNQISRWPPEPR
jgi:hypothetical protein